MPSIGFLFGLMEGILLGSRNLVVTQVVVWMGCWSHVVLSVTVTGKL